MALPGKFKRCLHRPLGQSYTLHAHKQARIVHHRKHAIETAIFLANQPARSTTMVAIDHGTGRGTVYAKLVFK